MTFVGKILVIVILAFSLFFLALSTVVFTASANWRDAYESAQEESRAIRGQLTEAQQELAAREAALQEEVGRLEASQQELVAQRNQLQAQIDSLREENTALANEAEGERRQSEIFAEQARESLNEALQLREQYQAAQKTANDLSGQKSELNQRIFNLERDLETATQNNESLRSTLADAQKVLGNNGLPTDPVQIARAARNAGEVTPDIEGKVLRVDRRNNLFEFSLGSDDGVVAGQVYEVLRTGEDSQYVGKARVRLVEADTSVAELIQPYLGRKVMEGDDVAGQINPRS